jgi:hypothetical protein
MGMNKWNEIRHNFLLSLVLFLFMLSFGVSPRAVDTSSEHDWVHPFPKEYAYFLERVCILWIADAASLRVPNKPGLSKREMTAIA